MRGRISGFTLLELLVAIGIMTLVAGTLYSALYIGTRASHSATSAIYPARMATLALELLRQDFDAALPPKGQFAGQFLGTNNANTNNFDELTFYAASNVPRDGESGGDIRFIDIVADVPANETQLVLMRKITTNLLAQQQPVPRQQVLCRGVKSLKLRYFDGTQWQLSWDSNAQNKVLPAAVEVTIEFDRDTQHTDKIDRGTYRMTRVYMLHCAQPVPQSTSN